MDPLVEISSEKWPVLRDLYENLWPEGAVAYCMLDSMIKVPNLVRDFKVKVYCPEGVMEFGMIATSSRVDSYQLIIQPIGPNTSKIEEALLKTKVIDWNQHVNIPSANDNAIKCLENIKSSLGLKLHYGENTKAFKHLLNKDAEKFTFRLPENTHIGPLTEEHLDLVNSTWTYQDKGSRSFFEALKDNGLTYVLYSAENKPITWICIDNFGTLKHLYTMKEYGRKGFAETITKCAINDLLSRGQHILAHTSGDNVKPKNMLNKLGFTEIGFDYWIFICKIKRNE